MLNHLDISKKSIVFVCQKLEEKIHLCIENDCLLEKIGEEKIAKVSLHKILSVIISGNFSITSNLINKLSFNNILVIITDDFLKKISIIEPEINGNYDIRKKQYLKNDIETLEIANNIVKEKLKNQNNLLLFLKKDIIKFENKENLNLKELLGFEGNFGREYFKKVFSEYNWYKRLPQSKIDELNFLLDFGYSLLFNLINCFCVIFGLDCYKGYYHQLYFERKSLVCDLIEPFRPIIDASIINIFKYNIYQKNDFVFVNSLICSFKNGYKTKIKYLKFFLKSILSHKIEIFEFIRSFYFYIADPIKYSFPEAKIDFSKLPISIK